MGSPPFLSGGKQSVWPLCLAAGGAALAACLALALSLRATLGWTLLAFYLPSFVDGSEYSGERYWPWFAHFCRRYVLSAVPTTLVCEETIDPTKQYIFASHPHGILSVHHGAFAAGSSKPSFHDISPMHSRNDLAATVVFRVPFYREWLIWLGCVDAGRSTAESVLRKGKSLVILVGGIAEQMLSQRGQQVIYAKKRKGHVRLALKYGVPIVPSYAFGETELYTHSKILLSFRQWLAKKFSLAVLISYGRSKLLPFAPYDVVVLNLVLGKPIQVAKIENPTQEDIDKAHQQYVDELVRIFNKYKKQYGYGDQQLQVL